MNPWHFLTMSMLLTSAQAGIPTINGASMEFGVSDSAKCDVTIDRIGIQKTWERQWLRGDSWHVGGYWELSFGHWENDSANRTNSGITDIGLTPTFRLERNHLTGFSPYVEAAIGIHILSHASVSDHRLFGSAFQFGDHVGLGFRFGSRNTYDLSYRFQHISNGGIHPPNKGINYNQLRFGTHF